MNILFKVEINNKIINGKLRTANGKLYAFSSRMAGINKWLDGIAITNDCERQLPSGK